MKLMYQKTWLTVKFYNRGVIVELTINYETKSFSITHSNNDSFVTFNGRGNEIEYALRRARCVQAALKFAKNELK
jgi:hypothetical protein